MNEHIPKYDYLEIKINFTFPRVDDLVEIINVRVETVFYTSEI